MGVGWGKFYEHGVEGNLSYFVIPRGWCMYNFSKCRKNPQETEMLICILLFLITVVFLQAFNIIKLNEEYST